MDNNELQHWGIMGMKWGIRRYQNKDGTLTPAGKKRYDKEMAKLEEKERVLRNKQRTQEQLDKLDAKRKEIDSLKHPKKTSSDDIENDVNKKKEAPHKKGELTKEELQEKVERLALEARIKELELKLNPPPPEAKKGESFLSKIGGKLAESGLELGKQYLSKEIEKYFKGEDPLADLKQLSAKRELESKIAESDKKIRDNEWDRDTKERNRKIWAEQDANKAAKKEAEAKAAEEKAREEAEKSAKAEKDQRVKNIMDVMKDFDGPIKNYTPGGKYKVNFDLSEYVSGYKSYNENYKSPTNSDYSNAGKSVVDNLLSDKDDD